MRLAGSRDNGPSRGAARRRGLVGVVLAVVLAVGAARAVSARQYRVVRYVEREGQIYLVVSVRDFFDRKLQRELVKGFQKVILVEARVYRSGRSRPVAILVRTYKVLYDLWASSFRITIDDHAGTRQVRVNTLGQTVAQVAELELPLGPVSRFPHGTLQRGPMFYTDVVIQFAPLPKGFLRKIRHWLRNPQGPASRGESPLGSRFSLFVNPRISRALKEWRFRTQKFYRP
jgi:hypothetical protein